MKIYIQSKSGDHNGLIETPKSFIDYVETLKLVGGFYSRSENGKLFFLPWHEIDYIEEK